MGSRIDGIKAWERSHRTATVVACRIFVALVFIVSGLSKGIDIWGFVYKIEEYLTVWGVQEPRSLVVMVALGLSGIEFVAGLMVLMGCYRRVAVWLMLALMAGMLPLTFYIMVANPVADCGCFGDLIRLSNTATFLKNVVVTAALVYLAAVNRKVKGLLSSYSQWIAGALSTLYLLIVALLGYNIQPLVDFRSYPVGTQLVASGEDDDVAYEFVYERDGEEAVFAIDNLPDSTWTFVSRRAIAGNEDTNIGGDLVIEDTEGDDVTSEAIEAEGWQMMIVMPQLRRGDVSHTYLINELSQYMERLDGSLIEVGDIPADRMELWRDLSMADYPIYRAESTVLKELSRGDMSAVLLKDGRIMWKRTLGSIDSDLLVSQADPSEVMMRLDFPGGRVFGWLTFALVSALIVLVAIDHSPQMVGHRRKKRRKALAESRTQEKTKSEGETESNTENNA